MTQNEQLFLKLIGAGLWEKEVSLSQYGVMDFEEIYRLAQEQSVVGLLAAGLGRVVDVKVPQTVALAVAGEVLQLEQRNGAMNHFVVNLIGEMRKAGIYTVLVKGQGVAQSYERPMWRACGDVDFFLSEENYVKAKNFLLPRAKSVEKEIKETHHQALLIDNWEVELHGSLQGRIMPKMDRVLGQIKRETFNDGSIRSTDMAGTQVFLLNMENDVVYVFLHFVRHFFREGVGLRQICDWCRLLWAYKDKLNVNAIKQKIEDAGMCSEWNVFTTFAVEYLGMPVEAIPFYSDKACWKKKAKRVLEFVLETGNFGHKRDMEYFQKYPYLVSKAISLWRHCSDVLRYSLIFPLDSLIVFRSMLFRGFHELIDVRN